MSDMDSNTPLGAPDANLDVSGGSAKLNSDDAAKIVAEVLKLIDPAIDKKIQSVKDKRFAEVDDIKTTQKMVLEKLGLTPEKAKDIGLFVQTETKTESVPTPPSGKEDGVGAIADKVLEASGIKLDDPNVLAYKQQTFASEKERLVAVAELVAKMANPKPASQAATPPPEGRTKDTETKESLTAKLNALNKAPLGKLDEIKRVKGELAQLDK